MKMVKAKKGPFAKRPYYDREEVDDICLSELISVDLLPATPSPIRIDRFIEKRFGITEDYIELPEGVLGVSCFQGGKVCEILISRDLDASTRVPRKRQLRATLAHEAGHVVLHGPLFAALGVESTERQTLLRYLPVDEADTRRRQYDGEWWEFQANMAIGSFLLPRELVRQAVLPLCASEPPYLSDGYRQHAINQVSEIFDVNQKVASIRLEELYPVQKQDGS